MLIHGPKRRASLWMTCTHYYTQSYLCTVHRWGGGGGGGRGSGRALRRLRELRRRNVADAFVPRPHQGLLHDTAVIWMIERRRRLCVCHRWQSIHIKSKQSTFRNATNPFIDVYSPQKVTKVLNYNNVITIKKEDWIFIRKTNTTQTLVVIVYYWYWITTLSL